MDSITSEVCKAKWAKTVEVCKSRPSGMTAKQWLNDNDVREKAYYYWQRRLSKEAYDQMTQNNTLPQLSEHSSNVSFAELHIEMSATVVSDVDEICRKPVAAIQLNNAKITITNDLSSDLLRCILQEVSRA